MSCGSLAVERRWSNKAAAFKFVNPQILATCCVLSLKGRFVNVKMWIINFLRSTKIWPAPTPKQLWLEALESGKFKQGKHALHTTNGEDLYCCLGVACIVAIRAGVEVSVGKKVALAIGTDFSVPYGDGLVFGILPREVQEWLGFRTVAGSISDLDIKKLQVGGLEYADLTKANDDGRTFKEIAQTIRNTPELFFD